MDQTFNTETTKTTEGHVKEINISNEMKTSFLNYAMSVIVSRALPDIRDGLKPVQRRILYAMNDLGMSADKQHKKSARIVGEVIGKYHPHGDSSVYEAMVRMAQPFNYRMPLIDGHGNFGSVDGDGAAAMRYTEARMSKLAGELVRDLEKNTVDYVDNYDGSEHEPSVLPSRYPNLLVNGSTGIAVGMATNIPPHNLGEVIDGLLAYMDNEEITIAELMQFIQGPDFPTGGQILGLSGLRQAYETGRGIIANRATAEIVTHKNKQAIVVTAIPYAVNKTTLIERIADIAKDKIVEGITDLRDESNRKGMRIVIELRKDVNPHVMLNNLYKHTQLQQSFGFNMICLVKGQPQMVTLKDMLKYYLEHQIEVVQRRTVYDLEKAEARQHILDGLVIALHDVDRAIEIIKQSKTGEEAREALIFEYKLTDIQARAILDMRLQRLTGIEIEKIEAELSELIIKIKDFKEIIESHERKLDIIKTELLEIKSNFADQRVTEINLHEDLSIEDESLIPVEDVIITVTNNGYIKRMNVDHYKTQNRGGVGMSGIKVHEDDYVEHIRMTSTHDYHLFFTNKGRVYKIKGYKVPEGSRHSKGLPIVNLLEFQKDECLASFTNVKDFEDEHAYLTFITKKGIIKRTPINEYQNIRTNGINAINLREDDELLSVGLTDGTKDIILGASNGKAIRFDENDARAMGRTTSGVRAMDLGKDDEVVGAAMISSPEDEILVITENGFGKRTIVDEYRKQIRGGKGVKTLNVTEKNGKLSTLRVVSDDQDLIVVSDKGVVIRTHIDQISQTKRATQGVRIIRLRPDHKVSTIALVPRQEEVLEELEENTFVQESMNVLEPKKTIEAVNLAPDEVEEKAEEKVTTDSLFDEE
ncbi:MAG: DNA gyrase subunit A [Acholeplasmataceae bacterium]|jgi:DNA gyrase subunit A|nr:DNA gyrase subunit A [Acholeplasmataceae bacterium]